MDRISFSTSLNGIDTETQAKLYFDQVMGLYNLVGEYENLHITGEVNRRKNIFFLIKFRTKKEVKEMESLLAGRKELYIYNQKLSISSETLDKKIKITLNPCA